MSRRGEVRGPHCALAVTAVLSLALLAAVVAAAFAAAGCGGSPGTIDLAPFVGRWERVEAGAPDPDFTLAIARDRDGVRLTFADRSSGMSQTVAGAAQGDGIACTLPDADGGAAPSAAPDATPASPAPGAPAETHLMLGLDDGGQLVIDRVLADGTLEPIWIYQRVEGMSPTAPGTL